MRTTLATMFHSLSLRNFRLYAAGQVVSVTGTWMMVTAQDWLVLSLTGNSGTALGLVTALQFAPLLLVLYGGRLADRYDKRVLLAVANLASCALALGLALLVFTGALRLTHLYVFALGLGLVNAVEVPTRLSFISELVGPELLPNASALSTAYFSVARVLGPAASGTLIAWLGTGWVMVFNGCSYLATVVGLLMMRPGELHRTPGKRGRDHRVIDGLRYVASRRDLTLTLVAVGVISLFGLNFQVTLPLIAKTVFHADAAAFGLLTTGLAAGSLLSAFLTTVRRTRPSSALVTGVALVFGVLEVAAGWAPTFALAVVSLALTGLASTYFVQAANHRIQLGSRPEYRGRVLALYTLTLQGTTPLGSLLVGALAGPLGARSGLWLGGLVSAVAAGVVMAADRRAGSRGHGDGASAAAGVRAE